MTNRDSAPIGTGVISVLTVLLVLTLSLFSALTLTSARADLALSRRNADTVSAWYRADSQAAELYRDFAEGLDEELTARLPVTEGQVLELHLRRAPDGTVEILAWQAAAADSEPSDELLPVWDGVLPE